MYTSCTTYKKVLYERYGYEKAYNRNKKEPMIRTKWVQRSVLDDESVSETESEFTSKDSLNHNSIIVNNPQKAT